MSASLEGVTRQFSFDEIKVATNNFDKARLLGGGGEGKVYKGLIKVDHGGTRSDVTVAIKCLTSKFRGHKFENEINLISKLHHGNLLSLKGYCQEFGQKILVYEYMRNGSLAENLYPDCSLSWIVLLKICIGAARGLDYLHHGTSAEDKIIHRDVKPGNILLDDKWVAKICDFGLSKKGPADQQQSETIKTKVRGTIGYLAPEYVFSSEVTRKTDVYAFGIVLLEVLCRKRRGWPLYDDSNETNEDEEDIGQWARQNVATDLKDQISDVCLDDFIDIASRCLLKIPQDRPSMSEVVSKLQNILKLQNKTEAPKSKKLFPETATKPLQDSAWDDFKMRTANTSSQDISIRSNSNQDTMPSSSYKEDELEPSSSETSSFAFDSFESSSTEEDSYPTANIPVIGHRLVLYYSSYGSTSTFVEQSAENSLMVRVILKELFRVNVDERDVSKYEEYSVEHWKQLKYNGTSLPHLFVRGKYIGGVDVFLQLYRTEKLANLLGGSPITLTCDNCGDAMTCHVCVWSRKFSVCKYCNALAMVSREEEVNLRYCSECQMSQLFLRTLILRDKGVVLMEGSSLSCVQYSSDLDPWWEYVTQVSQGSSVPSTNQLSEAATSTILICIVMFFLYLLYPMPKMDWGLLSVLKTFIDGLDFLSGITELGKSYILLRSTVERNMAMDQRYISKLAGVVFLIDILLPELAFLFIGDVYRKKCQYLNMSPNRLPLDKLLITHA